MKPNYWLAFSGAWLPFLAASPTWATEEHLLRVFQPLATAPGIEVAEIVYLTAFGALEETAVGAVTWPALLDSPHENRPEVNLNLAHLINLQVHMHWNDERHQWRVTFDLTELKSVPEDLKKERLDDAVGLPDILEKSMDATERNLRSVGVFDCEFNVLAEDSYEELRGFVFPAKLNRSDDVWGPWPYDLLQEKYDEGRLHQLAARSLSDHASLATVFLVAASESFTPEAEKQLGAFLRRLLARVGDDAFSKNLEMAEEAVRLRVAKLLVEDVGRGSLDSFFPKTVAHLPAS